MDCYIENASAAFLGVLVTVFALCVLTDHSNFLLRSLVIILRKPLQDSSESCFSQITGDQSEITNYKIAYSNRLVNREYFGRLIALLVNNFPQFLNATLYAFIYAISIFVLDEEFRYWMCADSKEAFFTTLFLYTLLSSGYWVYVWLRFCCTFKRGFENMSKDICSDVLSYSQNSDYKPKEKYMDRNLRTLICIFLSILFLSWLLAFLFPNLFGFLNHNEQLVSHFSLIFILLNGFIIPFTLTWFLCCLTNISFFFKKKKWKLHLTLPSSLCKKKK